ncbi:MAG: hypothetical protein LBL62_07325 [Planctomycetaceae bacterium]|nr:hypothetical protein [Planctomycetaceae bacterium]
MRSSQPFADEQINVNYILFILRFFLLMSIDNRSRNHNGMVLSILLQLRLC